MTIGVGGVSPQQALATLTNMTHGVAAISDDEFNQRIQHAQRLMAQHGLEAIYVNAGTNLY